MKSIEEFFSGLALRQSSSATSLPASRIRPSVLPDAVRQAANRGWHIFPVSQLAKLTANPDLLIGEATAEIARLEELAAEYPSCDSACRRWSTVVVHSRVGRATGQERIRSSQPGTWRMPHPPGAARRHRVGFLSLAQGPGVAQFGQ